MPQTLVNSYEKGFKDSRNVCHVLIVWTIPSLGDWAALTVDGVWVVEVTGQAVSRLQLIVDTLVAATGG